MYWGNIHKQVKLQIFYCVCVSVDGRGGRFAWMSHIVPARPGDIAGGQRRMEPERGDSDK